MLKKEILAPFDQNSDTPTKRIAKILSQVLAPLLMKMLH